MDNLLEVRAIMQLAAVKTVILSLVAMESVGHLG